MSDDLRRSAVAALVALADAGSYRDRADAGRALASFAERPDARGPLLRLLLDAEDTLVTLETATALLRRHDRAGLDLVARAMAGADPDQTEWLGTAVREVLGIYATERDAALRECAELAREAGTAEADGPARLVAALADLDPVLWPAGGRAPS